MNKLNLLLTSLLLTSVSLADKANDEYPDFYRGDTAKGLEFIQTIRVQSPAYRAEVKGNVKVTFTAAGMTRAIAKCWQQSVTRPARAGVDDQPGVSSRDPDTFGSDAVLADLALGADGKGSFNFPADKFPNGPVTIRIQAMDERGRQDYCELQLFNLGGVKWRQGLPKTAPAAAAGLKLVFADDFDGPLSISSDGRGAKYAAHKTGGGDFSGWPFSDPAGVNQPFGQQGTFLRIHASKPEGTKGRTGILSSIRSDGTGVAVPVPAYFECRLICQSAPGTWGAFWTLTKGTIGMKRDDPLYEEVKKAGCDELDVLECYGGYGKRNPNAGGHYGITTHFWGQDKDPRLQWARKKLPDGSKNPNYIPPHLWADAMPVGGHSSWSWTFHDYGMLITESETIYYLDGVEMLRHPTGPVTQTQETWFLINYAIGGISGWPIDLERYANASDMWVDWVRVYCGKPLPKDFGKIPTVGVKGAVGVSFTDGAYEKSVIGPNDIAGDGAFGQKNWNNLNLAHRKLQQTVDSDGNPTKIGVAVGKDARFEACQSWGTRGGDELMHRGAVADAPVGVKNVPYKKWDLAVHFGAGINGWDGSIELLTPNGKALDKRSVNFGWVGDNRYSEGHNIVVFKNLTIPAVALRLTKSGGKGAAAIAGLQVIPH